MPKVTIYVPDELKSQMDAVDTINWSAVAQAAFTVALEHAERPWLRQRDTRPARKKRNIRPSRKILAALEKIFAAETELRLPFQPSAKAKIYTELCDKGLVQPYQQTFGAGGRFPVTVTGYQLTHAGRIMYCNSCRDYVEEEPE